MTYPSEPDGTKTRPYRVFLGGTPKPPRPDASGSKPPMERFFIAMTANPLFDWGRLSTNTNGS